MLEEMVRAVIKKTLEDKYSHLVLPAVAYATITSGKRLDNTFEERDLTIHNEDSGGSFRGRMVSYWHEYTLNMVDRFGNRDESFPAVPGVRSKLQLETGAFVAVALYGNTAPAIIGEVSL